MSQSESVNVDVDSVGHNSEPTTVETRVSISNVEMSVSNPEGITSIEVNSPVPLDHEDSILDEVRSEEKLVIPVTTQESTASVALPLPVELVIDRWGLPFQRSLKGRKQVRATGRNSARNKTKTSGYLSGELRSRSVTIMNTLSL